MLYGCGGRLSPEARPCPARGGSAEPPLGVALFRSITEVQKLTDAGICTLGSAQGGYRSYAATRVVAPGYGHEFCGYMHTTSIVWLRAPLEELEGPSRVDRY